MIYTFDTNIGNEIDFYYKNIHKLTDFTEFDEDSYKDDNSAIYRYGNEICVNENVKNIILKKIKNIRKSGKQSFLSTSTITPSEYEFHPLTNIHIHWCGYLMRDDISWSTKNGVSTFPKETYNFEKKLSFNKNKKSIISVRKELEYRNYLFSKISPDKNSIFRYAKYVLNPKDESKEDLKYSNQFPTWNELLKEYDNSIFAFVCETYNGDDANIDCQISEKTLLSFMNGNITIIMGQKNVVKLLKDIGLYVWNDEFGFEDGDNSDDYNYRVDKFVNCYNNIKNMSFDESKQYWLSNQDKIQKNYDIISNLVNRKWHLGLI